MVKYVKVVGGFMTGGSDDESKGGSGVFTSKKTVIVRETELGALFRRDWELCSMQTIRIYDTNERPRNELPVRY